MRITTEGKYFSVFFVLIEAEKVDQKNNTLKKDMHIKIKITQRWKFK